MAVRQPPDIRSVLVRVLRAGVYVAPVLPLYVSPSLLFPYVTGRNFAFRILIELLLIPLAALWALSKRDRPSRSPLAIALLVFVTGVGLADVLGVDPYRSFWSTYQRMAGLLGLIHFALFFFILKTALDTRDAWMRYFSVSVAASVVVGLMALVELAVFRSADVVERPAGTIGNAGILAGYAMLHVFLGLAVAAHERRPGIRRLLIASVAFNVLLVVLTGTRAAALGLLVAAPAIAVGWPRPRAFRAIAASRFARTAAVIVAAGLAAVLVTQEVPFRANFERAGAGTGAMRLVLWSSAWQAAQERPWTGWGQESLPLVRDRYHARLPGENSADRTHNAVLDWLVAGGIPVLIAYLVLLILLVRRIWALAKSDARTAAALGGLVTAYFVFSLLWFDTLESQLVLMSVMAFADGPAGRVPAADPVPEGPRRWSTGAAIATTLVALMALAAAYGFNLRPMLLARDVIAGSNAWLADRNLTRSLAYFERAFAYRGLRSEEAIETMAGHVPQVVATRADIQPLEVKAFVDRAIGELGALTASPAVEVRHLRLLGTTAGSASRLDPAHRRLAVESFNRAIELSPRNEDT